MKKMAIWALHKAISRRLLVWSGFSVLLGLALLLTGRSFLRGFGIQAAAWGAIDGAIALFGRWFARRRQAALDGPSVDARSEREARNLRRLLRINAALDVLYVSGGLALALTLGRESATWQGHGWGIVVQGGFLFFFDLIHAQSVPVGAPPSIPSLFQGPEHQPFQWPGGRPAALLVHGFPGTPAELRAAGELLHLAGWTVRGMLLPGFGPEIATLTERRYDEWLGAVEKALHDLGREHAPVMVIGYSMGAALSIVAAAACPVDGMVLISPFWRLGSWFQGAVGTMLRPFLSRGIRPMRGVNLDQPHIRHAIAKFLPHIDLDDPEVQRQIRELRVPIALLDQVRIAGRRAYRAAPKVRLPLLVLQGESDEVAAARYTRRLVRRFRITPHYREVPGGHEVIEPSAEGWPIIEQEIRAFARSLRQGSG